MNRPEWCPADVWEVAVRLQDELYHWTDEAEAQTQDTLSFARAILAERERCANDPLKGLFQSEFDDALSETDIEDPRAAKQFAAEEAFGRLLDRLSDLMSGFAR